MTTAPRTSRESVTFARPFSLRGVGSVQPAGTYVVETEEELIAWKDKLEAKGLEVMQVRHEIIDSIYVTDPNGYAIEIAWQTRAMNDFDAVDANLTLEAAIAIEQDTGGRVQTIDEIWQRKAGMVDAYLAETA